MDKRRRRSREAIQQAFVELLDEQGYSRTTVQDIISRAGVGRATFYAQFHSKDDLLEAQVCDVCCHAFEPSGEVGTSPLAQTEHVLAGLHRSESGLRELVSGNGLERFADCLRHAIVRRASERIPACPAGPAASMNRSILEHHIAASFVGLVRWWAWHDFAMSAHEVALNYLRVILPLFGEEPPTE